MPGALKPIPFYGVEEQKNCWLVSLSRNSRRWVKAFAFNMYGGRHLALQAAQAWRDVVVREHPPILRRDKASSCRSDNKTGISGVTCLYRKDGGVERWVAKTQLGREGRILQKSFSVSRYGDRARELAVAERQKQLEQMEGRILRHPAADPGRLPILQAPAVLPVLLREQVVRRDHQSGVVGVSCVRSSDGLVRAWVASTQLAPGRRLTASFSVKTYGEEGARALAIRARRAQLERRRSGIAP